MFPLAQINQPIPPNIENVWQMLAYIIPILGLFAGQVFSWWDNRVRMEKASKDRVKTDEKVEAVAQSVNGNVDRVIEASAKAEYARGAAEALATQSDAAREAIAAAARTASELIVTAAAEAVRVAAAGHAALTEAMTRLERENAVSIADRAELHAANAAAVRDRDRIREAIRAIAPGAAAAIAVTPDPDLGSGERQGIVIHAPVSPQAGD